MGSRLFGEQPKRKQRLIAQEVAGFGKSESLAVMAEIEQCSRRKAADFQRVSREIIK